MSNDNDEPLIVFRGGPNGLEFVRFANEEDRAAYSKEKAKRITYAQGKNGEVIRIESTDLTTPADNPGPPAASR